MGGTLLVGTRSPERRIAMPLAVLEHASNGVARGLPRNNRISGESRLCASVLLIGLSLEYGYCAYGSRKDGMGWDGDGWTGRFDLLESPVFNLDRVQLAQVVFLSCQMLCSVGHFI
jgi:hypothetical protein